MRGGSPLKSVGRCRADFEFHPTTVGVKQATLRVTYADLDQTFSVRGTAVAVPARVYASRPDLYIRPPEAGFLQGFMIINGGATSVDLGMPLVATPSGVFPFGFSGWNCPSTLTPGGACSQARPFQVILPEDELPRLQPIKPLSMRY
jgi:hypothetical protein